MKLNKKGGFTLIELLVVITIIGILATGAVSVFTTQLQGARDSTRISDMKVTETAIIQYNTDNDEYPDAGGATTSSGAFLAQIRQYVSKDITDPKTGKNVCINSATTRNGLCAGYYNVGKNDSGIDYSTFKLSVRFEKEGNKTKMSTDGDNSGSGEFLYDNYGGGTGGTLPSPTLKIY